MESLSQALLDWVYQLLLSPQQLADWMALTPDFPITVAVARASTLGNLRLGRSGMKGRKPRMGTGWLCWAPSWCRGGFGGFLTLHVLGW